MQLVYGLTQASRDAAFLASGSAPDALQQIDIDPVDLPEPARRGLLARRDLGFAGHARIHFPAGFSAGVVSGQEWLPDPATVGVYTAPGVDPEIIANLVVVDHPLDVSEVIDLLARLADVAPAQLAALAAARAEAAARRQAREAADMAERAARRRAEDERDARRRRAEDERDARQRAEAERREAERAAWVAAHGSAFLQRAVAAGYDCQRRYVEERAAIDLPGFDVDFDGRAEWRSRSCPSEGALDRSLALREQGHVAEVVWLTTPADQEYPFEPCEAVAVTGYLGRYTLISR